MEALFARILHRLARLDVPQFDLPLQPVPTRVPPVAHQEDALKMRPGMQCLLDLLRGQIRPSRVSEPEWMALLQAAEEDNLLPWVSTRLMSMHGKLSSAIIESARGIHREAQQSAFVWTSALKHTLAAFHQRGVPVISLKGPWLAERLYGDAAARSCSDLDVLVRPPDLVTSEDLLAELGFSPCGPWDDRHRPWRRENICIELHHNVENPAVLDFEIEKAWDRAELSKFHGVPAWRLAPSDELRFLCLHAVRHGFDRLSLLLDLRFAFQLLPLLDTSIFDKYDSEFNNMMALCWIMARRLEGSCMSDLPGEWLGSRQRLEALADQLWLARTAGPISMSEYFAAHRFPFVARYRCFIQCEDPGWRRLRRRIRFYRFLLTRVTEADFVFAARLNLKHKWQVRMLKPIHLLLKAARIHPAGRN